MRTIMVMYDTLCRNFLSPYGNTWVQTPNFQRLAEKSVTFDTNYVCSLPCMPARRDLHNGRVNFLQRDWGPLEPYDDSMPEILKNYGIYSCLISDHYHYWEDGGCTYHNRYSSWISHRGQEGDFCRGTKEVVEYITGLGSRITDPRTAGEVPKVQDAANRRFCQSEREMPQAETFADGLAFIKENRNNDNWFLQIETFDPHEPFFTQKEWKDKYPELAGYTGSKTDWPAYDPVRENETAEDIGYVRHLYAALVSMCDSYLGKVLDAMDEYDLWKDTMLIVNTDHGFLLGEHDWWGKSIMPAYEEISHTPLFIYDPVSRIQDRRRAQLTSAIDIPATILDFHGLEIPEDMQGHSLLPVIRENQKVRDTALFGFHASHVAITDGRYTYFRAPLYTQESNCYEYTLMPTRMRRPYSVETLRSAILADPLPNSKGCPVLKTKSEICYVSPVNFGTRLFDVSVDPMQKKPVEDDDVEAGLSDILYSEMERAGAQPEQFVRLGLEGTNTPEGIAELRKKEDLSQTPAFIPNVRWTQEAKNAWRAIQRMLPPEATEAVGKMLPAIRAGHEDSPVTYDNITGVLKRMLPPETQPQLLYYLTLVARAY